ncbi:Adenylate kinase isoenzyme 6 HBR1 [Candida viswanathii]|uniref:Adenylate kinase isoenzyme 6 homolog n=1 Tax=Candida viswanathii TaxID=5486 RepID=A0A367XQL8_9ASCO|nr:Adenylate kinase isoenzyme 6 HBR1 [Candida viswanathii]
MTRRQTPNIIITGTPGCGKSSHSQSLVSQLNQDFAKDTTISFKHFNISEIAKERDCIESYDAKLDTSVVDEDKLLDSLEPDLEKGGVIVDWHCCDIFPERLIDLVVVLRTDNSNLYDRLKTRNYNDLKLQENLDCEIMEVILQEARDSYIPDIVVELRSDSAEEMDENVERISSWVIKWIEDHPNGVSNELEKQYHDDDSEEEDSNEEDEYELEQEEQEEEEEREAAEEETNEEMEHTEDIAQ